MSNTESMRISRSAEDAIPAAMGSMPRVVKIALWIAFCLTVIFQIISSFKALSPTRDNITDGPIQLYNWLRRIDDGQIPGRDFDVFHGIGIPYVHYPVYRLFGGDFFASELSRQLICRLSTLAAYLLISRLLTKHYTMGILWSLTTMLPEWDLISNRLITVVRFTYSNVVFAYEPGASMYGLRGLLPLIFASTCILKTSRKLLFWQIAILSAAFFVSIEHGTALYLAFSGLLVLLWGCSFTNRVLRPLAKHYTIVWSGSLLLTLSFLLLTCGVDGIRVFFAFHFEAQMQDQTWYFGGPPVFFLLDGYRSTLIMTCFLGVAVLGSGCYLLISFLRLRRVEKDDEARSVLFRILALAYGVLTLASLLGIMIYTGATGFARVMYLFASLVIYKQMAKREFSGKAWRTCSGVLILIVALQLTRCIQVAAAFSGFQLDPNVQKIVTMTEALLAEDAQTTQPNRIWSAYSGLSEAKEGIFHPTRWDYIIHALGPARQEYSQKFQEYQPKYVVTIRNDTDWFEDWLRATTFPFYRTLIFNYRIVAETPFSLIWKHIEPGEVVAWESAPVELQPTAPLHYQVPGVGRDEDLSLVVIEVEYETHNPWSWLPVLGNCPRYLVKFTGSKAGYEVSLPPQLQKHTFSVIPIPGEEFCLDFVVRGIRWNAAIDVKKVRVTKITLDSANRLYLKPSFIYLNKQEMLRGER